MRRSVSVVLYLCLLLLAGCGASTPVPPPTRAIATLFPTAAISPPAPAQPAALPTPDSGWRAGRPGVELRHMQAAAAPGRAAVQLVIVRIDPAQVRLHVAYAPDRPRGLRTWFEERRPLAAINGSFFTKEYRATARSEERRVGKEGRQR